MRDLLASDAPGAGLAIDYFVYRIVREAGAWRRPWAASTASCSPPASASAAPRSAPRSCERLAWLGLELDAAANAGARAADLDRRQPDQGLCRPDRRGADDRPPHAASGPGRPGVGRMTGEQPMLDRTDRPLEGRKGLVTGIANDQSIAWGCAKAFRALGADLAITYLNEQGQAARRAAGRASSRRRSCCRSDLREEGQLEAVFEQIAAALGPARLRPPLDRLRAEGGPAWPRRRLLEGRLPAGDGRLLLVVHPHGQARRAADEPTAARCSRMTYYGSQMVVENYNMMGPVKAALEVRDPLPGRRARPEGHPRARDLAGPAQDPRRLGHRRVRRAA